MGAVAKKFADGVADLASVKREKLPVAKDFPNAQNFVQAVDNTEKLGSEMLVRLGALKKALDDYNKVQGEWAASEAVVDKGLAIYGKSLKGYIARGREFGEKSYEKGCTSIGSSLDEVTKMMKAGKRDCPKLTLKPS